MIRPFFVGLHRWAGLAMAGFLVVVALTGSLLAVNSELERLISPQLSAAPNVLLKVKHHDHIRRRHWCFDPPSRADRST